MDGHIQRNNIFRTHSTIPRLIIVNDITIHIRKSTYRVMARVTNDRDYRLQGL